MDNAILRLIVFWDLLSALICLRGISILPNLVQLHRMRGEEETQTPHSLDVNPHVKTLITPVTMVIGESHCMVPSQYDAWYLPQGSPCSLQTKFHDISLDPSQPQIFKSTPALQL